MIIVDAHTHLGNDIYAGEWSGEAGAAAADEYARIMRAAGVHKGFTFTMSATGMPSVMQTISGISAWIASAMASAAPGGGT